MLFRFLIICAISSFLTLDRKVLLKRPYAATQASEDAPSQSTQPAAEQEALIRKAETNHYSTRRLEFIGNKHTRDNILRRRMHWLNEGRRFTRRRLVTSLSSVSRLKIIHRVRLRDVVLRIDESDKHVDNLICFREKNHRARAQSEKQH